MERTETVEDKDYKKHLCEMILKQVETHRRNKTDLLDDFVNRIDKIW